MKSFSKLVADIETRNAKKVAEVAPPGFKGTAKAMKKHKDIKNPFALAWYEKNKGDKSHYKANGTKKTEDMNAMESVIGKRVEHPTKGAGKVTALGENRVDVLWDNLGKKILGPQTLTFEQANYLTIIEDEDYSDNPSDADVMDSDDEEMQAESKGKMMKKNEKKADKKAGKKIDEAMMAIPTIFPGSGERNNRMVFDLTAEDIGLVFEDADTDEPEGSPNPSNSILTKQKGNEMKVSSDSPLSVTDGAEAASDDALGDLEMPEDHPDVPNYRELEKPGEGNTRQTHRPGTASKTSTSSKSESGESDQDTDETDYKTYEKANEKDFEEKKNMAESRKSQYRQLVEAVTMRDLDECDCEDEMREDDGDADAGIGRAAEHEKAGKSHDNNKNIGNARLHVDATMKEHNLEAGEIAVTQELLNKLLTKIRDDQPDDDLINDIVVGLATAVDEDRTLTVDDIGTIMARIREIRSDEASADTSDQATNVDGDMDDDDLGSEDDGSEGDHEFEDKAAGDGEIAGQEAGDEHEGKIKMMDSKGKKAEDCGGMGMMETKGKKPAFLVKAEKKAEKKEGKKVSESVEVEDDEATQIRRMIARRAGIANYWKK